MVHLPYYQGAVSLCHCSHGSEPLKALSLQWSFRGDHSVANSTHVLKVDHDVPGLDDSPSAFAPALVVLVLASVLWIRRDNFLPSVQLNVLLGGDAASL